MGRLFTVQFVLEEGSDEFWDSNPNPKQVLSVLRAELPSCGLDMDPNTIKIVKVIDDNVYTEIEDWEP